VVVLVSLVVQGWSIIPIARWLGLEVPPDPAPDFRIPLDRVKANDILEVAAFEITDDSAAADHHWDEISLPAEAEFIGLIRTGKWIRRVSNPLLQDGDTVMILARNEDIARISEVLASTGSHRRITRKGFFGDFILNADVTLNDLAGFYALPEDGGGEDPNRTIAKIFAERFHRRVVVGDHIVIGNLVFTAREISETGDIVKVGVKAAKL